MSLCVCSKFLLLSSVSKIQIYLKKKRQFELNVLFTREERVRESILRSIFNQYIVKYAEIVCG
jgi:hypothetical protein